MARGRGGDDVDMEDDTPRPQLRSVVTAVRKQKGRGFREGVDDEAEEERQGQQFEGLSSSTAKGPQQSVEGWVVFVTNVHEEATEEDLVDYFMDFGSVKNSYMNLDRQTGFAKGYAVIEYATKQEAQTALDGANNGPPFLTNQLKASWCFQVPPKRGARGGAR